MELLGLALIHLLGGLIGIGFMAAIIIVGIINF